MVSTVALQQEGPGFDTWLSMWNLYVLPVTVWVPSGNASVLPQSKDMQATLTGDSKLPVGVNVSMNGCFSLYVSHVVN